MTLPFSAPWNHPTVSIQVVRCSARAAGRGSMRGVVATCAVRGGGTSQDCSLQRVGGSGGSGDIRASGSQTFRAAVMAEVWEQSWSLVEAAG